MAGALWNLEWLEGRGPVFSFMRDDWPTPGTRASFRKIAWLAIPLMLLVGLLMARFLFP
jgi:hypothetical protein